MGLFSHTSFELGERRASTRKNHPILATQSGTLAGAQLYWSTIEQEAYHIAVACDKLDHLLFREI